MIPIDKQILYIICPALRSSMTFLKSTTMHEAEPHAPPPWNGMTLVHRSGGSEPNA